VHQLPPVNYVESDTTCRHPYSFSSHHIPYRNPPTQARYNGEWVSSVTEAHSTRGLMGRSWAPFIGLLVVVIFCAAAWILSPKGENQTYVPRFPRTHLCLFDRAVTRLHTLFVGYADAPSHSVWRLRLHMICVMRTCEGRDLERRIAHSSFHQEHTISFNHHTSPTGKLSR
jgi:hypothetical protein